MKERNEKYTNNPKMISIVLIIKIHHVNMINGTHLAINYSIKHKTAQKKVITKTNKKNFTTTI